MDDFKDMMPTSEEMYNYHGDEYVGQSKYQYVLKECKRCSQKVDMSSDHAICDSCANAMERGWEY